MPFELFTPDKAVPRGDSMVTVTSYGRLALNKAATYRFEKGGVQHVQLLWDRDAKKVGIVPAEKDRTSFRLSYGSNGNGVGFGAASFLSYIQYDWTKTRNFPIHWDENSHMYVFAVPEEHLGHNITGAHLKRNREGADN